MSYHFSNPVRNSGSLFASRTEPESAARIAHASWWAMLGVMVVGMIGAVLWGGSELSATFAAFEQGNSTTHAPAPALNRAQLSATTAYFADAPSRFSDAKSEGVSIGDPSK